MSDERETQSVAERYARRTDADRYSILRPDVWQLLQERQRALLRGFNRRGLTDLPALQLTEVGCGSGGNLLELLRMGFAPEHLQGIELLPERHAMARRVLPPATRLWLGDATDSAQAPIAPASQHLVLQATVFSSLLDDAFQQRLADTMWRWLRPGGAVIWYDFTMNNPRNPDVRGVPLARLRALFPQARVQSERITLAPPLARLVCGWHPSLYTVLNAVPLLRSHVLAWVEKPM
jgi:SAM-dependent methyltransferase